MDRIPQQFTILLGDADHFTVATRVQDDFLIHDQPRPKVERKLIATTDRFGFPGYCARSVIDTDQFFAIVEIDS